MPAKKTPAQLQRDIDEALARRHGQARERWLSLQAGPRHRERKAAYGEMAALARDLERSKSGNKRHHSTMLGGVNSVSDFWDLFEEELTKSVAEAPEKYALRPDEPPEVYARRIRVSFQQTAEEKGLRWINLDSTTWKRVAKRIGVTKFSQGRLKEAYAALGGKVG